MFCSRKSNNAIKKIHERALRITLNNSTGIFVELLTLRCPLNGGWRFLLNLINEGFKINGGGWNFQKSVNIGNEWKMRHKCLILMLNIKVSRRNKQEVKLIRTR